MCITVARNDAPVGEKVMFPGLAIGLGVDEWLMDMYTLLTRNVYLRAMWMRTFGNSIWLKLTQFGAEH